jgi:hypothetical protein
MWVNFDLACVQPKNRARVTPSLVDMILDMILLHDRYFSVDIYSRKPLWSRAISAWDLPGGGGFFGSVCDPALLPWKCVRSAPESYWRCVVVCTLAALAVRDRNKREAVKKAFNASV